jgi:hypothetical protein
LIDARLIGTAMTSVHCAIAVGSLPATKWKKLRIAASRQLRVPIVPFRSCSAWPRNALTSLAVRSLDFGDLFTFSLRDEAEEQAPGVAIGADGMNGGIALLGQPLLEEAA